MREAGWEAVVMFGVYGELQYYQCQEVGEIAAFGH